MTLIFTQNSLLNVGLFRRACRKRPKSARGPRDLVFFAATVLLGAIFAVGAIVTTFIILKALGANDQRVGLMGPFVGLLGAFALRFYIRREMFRRSAFPYVAGEETQYELSAEGVSVTCKDAQVRIGWGGLQGFVEGVGGLFFYHGAIVLVIPDEALGERRADAVAAIKDWYKPS